MASLANLSGSSYVSNSGLANVLQKLRSNPELLEAGVSRWAVKRKRVADVSAQSEFGDVFRSMDLETKDGGSLKCWYAHPVCILERALTRSPGFRDLFLRLLEGNPARWHLVAYSDEVTPGNNLKPLNRRKCWVILEFLWDETPPSERELLVHYERASNRRSQRGRASKTTWVILV